MQDTEEIWKDVVGYEGLYQVSNLGRVKKLNSHRLKSKRFTISHGYLTTSLSNGPHTRKVISIHRLVANAFIPNPENKPHINHINGSRRDNRVENLEWCTPSENIQHAYKSGLAKRGKPKKRHSIEKVKQIIHLRHNHHFSFFRISILTGVPIQTVIGISNRKSWTSDRIKDLYKEMLIKSVY